jgi:hypothetical protein
VAAGTGTAVGLLVDFLHANAEHFRNEPGWPQVLAAFADLEATRAQLLAARHIAAQKAVLVLGDGAQPQEQVATENQPSTLTSQPRKALATAISDRTMNHWGWTIDKSGRVLTDSGQVLFGVGFVSAIRKLVG